MVAGLLIVHGHGVHAHRHLSEGRSGDARLRRMIPHGTHVARSSQQQLESKHTFEDRGNGAAKHGYNIGETGQRFQPCVQTAIVIVSER